MRTQPIWHCPEVTREEAVTLLHNKKEGVSRYRAISAERGKHIQGMQPLVMTRADAEC